jgi:hypothetical protein
VTVNTKHAVFWRYRFGPDKNGALSFDYSHSPPQSGKMARRNYSLKSYRNSIPNTKERNMGEVIKFRRRSLSERYKGKTLCVNGFHQWRVETAKQFDVRQGKLVTLYKCARCGATRTEAR